MSESEGRLASLDQFRGYTVLGMLVVNFGGAFRALPETMRHHHTHFSYADSIMPQFLFAVGFALRLTLLRRWHEAGPVAAYRRAIGRVLTLIAFGVLYHGLSGGVKAWAELETLGLGGFLATAFQRETFQTLTHIGVTSLWVLPVIAAGAGVRVAYLAASAALFWYVSVHHGYYTWAVTRPAIDGGPLGFLTWTTPLLVGSLAYDAGGSLWRLLAGAVGLMALGYALACASGLTTPPFMPPMPADEYHAMSKGADNAGALFWVMSQRAGSVSYLVFGAGFALAVYAAFVALPVRGSVLDTFGANALAAYVVHDFIGHGWRRYKPPDAPLWYAVAAVAVYVAACYAVLRWLERRKLFVRL